MAETQDITDAITEVNRIHMILLFDQQDLAIKAELKQAVAVLAGLLE
jgi:hypothetical protein